MYFSNVKFLDILWSLIYIVKLVSWTVFALPGISVKRLLRAIGQNEAKGLLKTIKVLGLEGPLSSTKYNTVKITNGRQLPI